MNMTTTKINTPVSFETQQMEYMSIIQALAKDVSGLYVIDREKKEVTAYRISVSDHRIRNAVPLEQKFEVAMGRFIQTYVHPDDQDSMKKCIRFDHMEEALSKADSFTYHFRIIVNGKLHYNNMRCLRNISSDEYNKIIVAFSPEDELVKMRNMAESLHEIELDDLTGLYTKQAFYYHARLLLGSDQDTDYTVVISDIQNFKVFNSTYGVEAGDAVLKHLGAYLKDAFTKHLCARYGGDQFIVLLPTSEAKAFRTNLSGVFSEENKYPLFDNVVIKFGIYLNVDHTLSINRICDRALQALKSIKHNYGYTYALWNGPVSQLQLKEEFYESHFKSAIRDRDFLIYLQPKYNPYTNLVIGAEALVRWNYQGTQLLPPGEFLPVFERNGSIRELDEYVFRLVCEHQAKWKQLGKEMIPVSVNLSRNSMLRPDLVESYKAILDEYDLSPSLIPIEITETAAIRNEELKPVMDAFFKAGFVLHMDDFGSEHSSLAGLNMLHFDVVKMDKSLIDFIGDKTGDLVLKYTMALGKELGLTLVAEGVETEDQLNFLKANGCDAIQGYYYSKPLPIEEFELAAFDNLEYEPIGFNPGFSLFNSLHMEARVKAEMLEKMPGGFFTYVRGGDEHILSSNWYLWKLYGCDSEEDFMEHVGGSFKGMVSPEDLDRVELFIEQQIQENIYDMDYVEYDIIRKDGVRVPVVDYGHLVRLGNDEVFYVFINTEDLVWQSDMK